MKKTENKHRRFKHIGIYRNNSKRNVAWQFFFRYTHRGSCPIGNQLMQKEVKASKEEIFFLWQKYINPMVSLRDLDNNIMALKNRGFKLDYILFCLKYIIAHKINLRYPAGLKYYIDREDIRRAYNLSKIKRVDVCNFKTIDNSGVDFTFNKNQQGFHRILKNNY